MLSFETIETENDLKEEEEEREILNLEFELKNEGAEFLEEEEDYESEFETLNEEDFTQYLHEEFSCNKVLKKELLVFFGLPKNAFLKVLFLLVFS